MSPNRTTRSAADERLSAPPTAGREPGGRLTRRAALRRGASGGTIGALLALGAPAAAHARTHRPAPSRTGAPTFVFVHGGWSDAFNFHRVVPDLQTAGHRALAIDLPGHGQDAHFPDWYLGVSQDLGALRTAPSWITRITLEMAVEYVTRVVTGVARDNGPVILLGHSSGGVVIGKVATKVPHLIDRLVYMSAYLVAGRDSAFDYFDPRPYFPNVEQLGVLRVNWRDPATLSGFGRGLFPLSSTATAIAFFNAWQPDFPLDFLTAHSRVEKETWGTIPRTYIGFANDGTITPASQALYIRDADRLTPHNKTDVHRIPGGHIDPFASPRALVHILKRLPEVTRTR